MSEANLQLQNKTILVTGGAGFIGSHLCEKLLELGAKVICFDNLSTGKLSNIKHLKGCRHRMSTFDVDREENFKFIRGDVNLYDDIRIPFLSYALDYVFHYAAVVGVRRVIENPLLVLGDIDGIKHVLELSLLRNIKKVVFASSSEAYGEPVELPEKEEGIHNPGARDTYALTKLVGENLVHGYFEKYGLPGCALRFFNVYGPRQESSAYGFVVGVFIRQVLEGKPPTIFGDGHQTRDFVYIDDNINAAIFALLETKTNGQTINIGIGKPTTILELAEKIINLSGKDLKPEFLSNRKVEIHYRCPDVTKMKELIGYEPRVGLDEGLKKTFEWYRSKTPHPSGDKREEGKRETPLCQEGDNPLNPP